MLFSFVATLTNKEKFIMATTTILQYLEKTGYNALPSGGTTDVGLDALNRRQVESFIAGEDLVIGDWVAFNINAASIEKASIEVVKADLNANAGAGVTTTAGIIVGVVLAADNSQGTTTLGSRVKVVTRGFAKGRVDNSGAAIGKGAFVAGSNTAGLCDPYAAADVVPPIGVLCAAAAGGSTGGAVLLLDVYVLPAFT
jgi:hypothetical protein